MKDALQGEPEREVCVWSEVDPDLTGCGVDHTWKAAAEWKFCPFCGKPMVAVEANVV